MSYIDIVILLILLYGAFRGFCKGLIVGLATLAGLVLGVFVAVRYSPYTEAFLRDFLNISSRYLSYIALGITFLVVVIAVGLLGKLLTKLVDIVFLGLVNKLLGAVLGAAKYFILICVLLLITDALDDKFHFISEETKQKNLLFYPFLNFAQQMYNTIRF